MGLSLSFVDLVARLHEHDTAIGQLIKGIGRELAGFYGDHNTAAASRDSPTEAVDAAFTQR